MILIYPPVVKPCEPPAGLARLAGALNEHGISHRILDANIEGLSALLETDFSQTDTWTRRAYGNRFRHLEALGQWQIYANRDRYRRAVSDINRLLAVKGRSSGIQLTLTNYDDPNLSAVRSTDLIRSAEVFETNLFYDYFSSRLSKLIEKDSPSRIGFSLNFLSQAITTFAMIGFVKRHFPQIQILLGGGLVTSWMASPAWNNPFSGLIDHIIPGPGETPLLALLGKTSNQPFYAPDYSAFIEKPYLAPGMILPYNTSTGCYWNRCSFCPEKAEKSPYRPVPPAQAVSELTRLTHHLKPSLIHLTDNAISPAMMKALCASTHQTPWYGFARITRHLTDLHFCLELKKSGCVMLKLGVESGSQTVLDEMNKGTDIGKVSVVLANLKKAGIATFIYLLFGTPSETLKEARQTLDFTVRHSDCVTFLNLAVFNLPVYGPDARALNTRDFYQADLGLYQEFTHPKGWNRRLVRQFLDKEFKRHPAVASILQNIPPLFTSNHAPLFVMSNTASDTSQKNPGL